MIALTAALIGGLFLCYLIASPFIPALVWSLTLALFFAPVEQKLHILIGPLGIRSRGVSVLLTLLLAALLVVTPLVLVSGALINEIIASADLMSAGLSAEKWGDLAKRYPVLSPAIHWFTEHLDLPQFLQTITTRLGEWSASFVQGSVTTVINLLLTFYFLFYLLRDRARALAALERMLPLSGMEFRTLVHRIAQTIYASVYGTAAVAALQGLLGGLMFWWLGLPSPLFWGVIMGLLAVVPFLGAFVIWVPVSIALALGGQFLAAGILVLWGTVVVGLVDNVLYPILVGRQLALHSLLSFIAIVGGLALFGAHGIVLGPVIVAAAQSLMDIWRSRLDRIAVPSPSDSIS